jgi:hypothetical protein
MACLQSKARRTMTIVAAIAALVISASAAQADPPGRVARLSFVAGPVSFRAATLDEWNAASLNYPLTIGDHIWADTGARAEMQLGSVVVRLGPHTEFSVLNLDDRAIQLRVTQGALSVRARSFGEDDTIEIDTPNGAVSLLKPGFYRVDVNEAGDTSTITVRHGEAEVTAGRSAFAVRAEESVALSGFDATSRDSRPAPATDDFDSWCLVRDRRAENAQSARYVSPDLIGYEDLDEYGTWQVAGEYGAVWMPRVRAEWVPYRFGHWVWVDPWGWTWVDDAPWGFAPFHYGRWVRLPGGWAWMPGTIVARPVYAPALVAFVGGSSWSVSLGFGSAPVAWFPLGPREVFVPAYRVSPVYLRTVNGPHVNVTNININVTNVTYVNREVPGAVTAVPRDVFVQARAVSSAGVAVPRDAVRSAPVVGATAPVAPQAASIAGVAAARVSAPPPAVASRQVVVRRAPPPAPLPFTAKQAALAVRPGQPVDPETESTLRTSVAQPVAHPLVKAVAVPRTVTPQPVNRPAGGAPANQPVQAAPSVQPAPVPPPRQVQPLPSTPAELAARHAQERAEVEARHAQERAEVQARHQQEEQAAADRRQHEQVQQQHQDEIKALQDRQKHEREEIQKRQESERQQQRRKPAEDKKGG